VIKELGEEFTDIGISDGYKIIATNLSIIHISFLNVC